MNGRCPENTTILVAMCITIRNQDFEFLGRPLSCKLRSPALCYGCRPSVVRRPSVCNGCIVVKRCKIGFRLLLIINKKWQTYFYMK